MYERCKKQTSKTFRREYKPVCNGMTSYLVMYSSNGQVEGGKLFSFQPAVTTTLFPHLFLVWGSLLLCSFGEALYLCHWIKARLLLKSAAVDKYVRCCSYKVVRVKYVNCIGEEDISLLPFQVLWLA